MASTAARTPTQAHFPPPSPSLPPSGAPAPTLAGETHLSGPQLLALQLVARGCDADEIAALRGVEVVEVLWDLQAALGALGALTVREAVERATRRGFIA